MFHNRGSIIAQYTYVIYIENDLVRLWIPAGALPLDPRSLALRFIGFTHSACHYYSQLFSTTQIGLATTLSVGITIFPISIYRWNYIVKNRYIGLYAGTQFQLQSMRPRLDIKSNVSGCTNPNKLTRRISAVRNSLRLKKKLILWRKKP